MAKQFSLPGNRAFNSNGLAIPGATVSLYVSGGLVPASFYSDTSLTTSLGSTLTANGAGRFANAYQDENTAFRLIVKDTLGAELDDIDPYYFGTIIGGLNDIGLRSDLAASSGTSLLAYLPAVGLSPVNLQTALRLGLPIAPEFFGAVGDGVTDDHAAIQAAIDHLVTIGGGTLRFAAKTYKISATLTWSGAAVDLLGDGQGIQPTGGTILKFPTGLSGAINPKNGPSGLGAGSSIRNLRVQGQAKTATVTITIASPGVVTWTGHGLLVDQPVVFSTSSALPTGLTAGTVYFVRSPATDTFQVAATAGGVSINTSGSQSGTHSAGATVTDANALLGIGAGILWQCPGSLDNVTVQGFEGKGFFGLSAPSISDVTINSNNSNIGYIHCYANLREGFSLFGVDSNLYQVGKIDSSNNYGDAVKLNGLIGSKIESVHGASNAGWLVHIGSISAANWIGYCYKEADWTPQVLLIDAGGGGRNFADLRACSGTIALSGTITITDSSGTGDSVWVVNGHCSNQGKFGTANSSVGTITIDDSGIVHYKGAYSRFQSADALSNLDILNSNGTVLFYSDQSITGNFYSASAVTFSYDASGLNIASGKVLKVAGSTVLTATALSLGTLTVATLPASPAVGTKAFVTDANAATFGSAVVGGGANKVPVFYDGAWKIG